MDPPAYTAPASAPKPPRTILDLRAQILANASLLNRSTEDQIEVIVAKAGAVPAAPSPMLSGNEKRPITQVMEDPASSSAANKHYALVVRRTYERRFLGILMQGEPRDSVEEALEWLLERMEREMHGMVFKYGKKVEHVDCSVM
ncbi:hypothetical protein Tdes44962_MAKER03778 [Teratosphaeria destructans]|uniref:Uncharacterized protein n=1 Tax=Teratosphaeria destructans TaxID=418781 RepID=A0A9W7SNS8_9PEZI|nr:hypothetical protein Tdes44962_MAKER03778 [Teratosphaeria destructans]